MSYFKRYCTLYTSKLFQLFPKNLKVTFWGQNWLIPYIGLVLSKNKPQRFSKPGGARPARWSWIRLDMTWERALLADANPIREKSKFPHPNLIFLQINVFSDYRVFVPLCQCVIKLSCLCTILLFRVIRQSCLCTIVSSSCQTIVLHRL